MHGDRQPLLPNDEPRVDTMRIVSLHSKGIAVQTGEAAKRCVRLFTSRKFAIVIAGILAAVAAPSPSFGQVQLPTVNLGETNFEDGFGVPGGGWFLQEFPESYVANEFKDSHGHTVPGTNHLTAYSTTTHVVFISGKTLPGGGSFAWEILEPMVDLDVRLVNGVDSRIREFADTTIGAGVQWVPERVGGGLFVHRVIFDLGLPTGNYSDKRPVNTGNHYFVFDPYYAATFELEKVEFSTRIHYLSNTKNDDPFVAFGVRNTQAGDAVHINYATSYAIRKNVRVGFNGYWLQQVTDDKIDGRNVRNLRERTVGLGIGLQINDRNIWYHLNAYEETAVRSRARGTKVIFRLSLALPNPPMPTK